MVTDKIRTYEELLEFLDLKNAEEFKYFENFADLVESEDELEEGAVFRLFCDLDKDEIAEMIDGYFDEIMDGIPDREYDIYMLFENIKMVLRGLITTCKEDDDYVNFSSELLRFRDWLSCQKTVIREDLGDGQLMSVKDAIAEARLAKLDGNECRLDFTPSLDYELDEYVVDIMALNRELEEEE